MAMGSLITYLETEQRLFSEFPFNEVDSLVLSTLCYFRFEKAGVVVPCGSERVLLHDAVALSDWCDLFAGCWLEDQGGSSDFAHAIMASRRYRYVEIGFFVDEFSSAVEKQFSAITFFLDSGACYLAFRGTDGTIVGWKEDFNMSFLPVIPSQRSAASYVSGVASGTTGPLFLGGHSKGGHLAEFAALDADQPVYERIFSVYNHDGPSFAEDPSPRMRTDEYACKLHKTVPVDSLFGMVYEDRESFCVVDAESFSVFQHNPFSWIVEEGRFKHLEDLSTGAMLIDDVFSNWIRTKDKEECERFVEAAFVMLCATEASTWAEFQSQLVANIATMVGEGGRLDSDTKRFLLGTLASLGDAAGRELAGRLQFAREFLTTSHPKKS